MKTSTVIQAAFIGVVLADLFTPNEGKSVWVHLLVMAVSIALGVMSVRNIVRIYRGAR